MIDVKTVYIVVYKKPQNPKNIEISDMFTTREAADRRAETYMATYPAWKWWVLQRKMFSEVIHRYN